MRERTGIGARRIAAVLVAPALALSLAQGAGATPADSVVAVTGSAVSNAAAVLTPVRSPGKVLYLTFDDGPVADNTPKLLEVLARNDARATFFLVGGTAARNKSLVRRIAREGHAIGNHTQGHPRLTDLTRRQVRDQLRWASRAIGPVQGPCMRPPYGLINKKVERVARAQGLTPVMWTGHIDDWHRHTVKWSVSQLRKHTKPRGIILMHDRNVRTIKAVSRMLPVWRDMGYRLESLPACQLR